MAQPDSNNVTTSNLATNQDWKKKKGFLPTIMFLVVIGLMFLVAVELMSPYDNGYSPVLRGGSNNEEGLPFQPLPVWNPLLTAPPMVKSKKSW